MGLLPYECRRDLERARNGGSRAAPHSVEPHWVRYAAVAEIGEAGVRVVGDDSEAVAALAGRLRGSAPSGAPVELAALGAFEAPELHRARIRRALEHIRAGDLYQVNLARRFELRVRGSGWTCSLGCSNAVSRRTPLRSPGAPWTWSVSRQNYS